MLQDSSGLTVRLPSLSVSITIPADDSELVQVRIFALESLSHAPSSRHRVVRPVQVSAAPVTGGCLRGKRLQRGTGSRNAADIPSFGSHPRSAGSKERIDPRAVYRMAP
jgi:hypothetical protein